MEKHIGLKIKELLDNKNYPKTQFALDLGMSENNLYKIFKKKSLEIDLLYKVSEILNVKIGYFIGDDIDNFISNTNNSGSGKLSEKDKIIDELQKDKEYLRKDIDFLKSLVISKLDNLEKLGKSKGVSTMNGVSFGILDFSELPISLN